MEKKLVLEELYRMRELMGITILSESTKSTIGNLLMEGGKTIDNIIGLSPRTVDNLTKNGVDFVNDLTKLSDEFATRGIKSFADLTDAVAISKGLDPKNITDEMIESYIKNDKELYQSILKKATQAGANTVDNLIKNVELERLFSDNLDQLQTYKQIFTIEPDANNVDDIIDQLNLYVNELDNTVDLLQRGGKTVPDELVGLIDELLAKKTDLDNFKLSNETFKSSPTPDPNKVSDAEMDYRKKEEEIRLQKEYETLKDTKIDDLLTKLGNSESFQKAFSSFQKIMEKIGVGNASKYLDQAKKEFGQKTLTQLEDPNILKPYTDELFKMAEKKLGKEGATLFIKKLGNFMKALDEFLKKIPLIGRFYKLFSAICGGAFLFWASDNIEFVNNFFNRAGRNLWDIFDNIIPGVNEFEKTLPYCFYEIDDYNNLTDEQQIKFQGLGFNCENVDPTKPDMLITKITYQNANSAMDIPEGFKITVGGTERIVQPGSNNTNTTVTYTNTSADFIKWVNTNHPGKYGTEYEWEGNSGYYYPGGGASGNAMTFSTSGWQ